MTLYVHNKQLFSTRGYLNREKFIGLLIYKNITRLLWHRIIRLILRCNSFSFWFFIKKYFKVISKSIKRINTSIYKKRNYRLFLKIKLDYYGFGDLVPVANLFKIWCSLCFFLYLRHLVIIFSTMSFAPHISYSGGSPLDIKKLCVKKVYPIANDWLQLLPSYSYQNFSISGCCFLSFDA